MAPLNDFDHGFSNPRFSRAFGRLATDTEDEIHPKAEVRVLLALSFSVGLLSILSTLFAFYWFVRMRRSFRHDLIMLLIQSDLIKSVWFVIFPIVAHARGPIASDSAFCQVSGFFLAVGIESSDVAILLIALHSALYIFRPKSGLYPYRRLAYAAYIIIPLLIASLAFLGGHGYENIGQYCYLEAHRGWTRVALSWFPRYVIFVIILLTYLCIYAYVRSMMFRPGKETSRHAQDCRRERRRGNPGPPGIEYHGLIPLTPSSARPSDRPPSISSANTIELDSIGPDSKRGSRMHETGLMNWDWATSVRPKRHTGPREGKQALSMLSSLLDSRAQSHASSRTCSVGDVPSLASTISTPRSTWQRPLASTPTEIPDSPSPRATIAEDTASSGKASPSIRSSLRQGLLGGPSDTLTRVQSMAISPGSIQDPHELARNRDKILRQFQSLFVYPLAYLATWIFPFVSHIMGYDDSLGANDPFWLLIISIISLSIQGTVDCAVFTIREAPWKHTQDGFWKSLDRRLRERWKAGLKKAHVVGRTREEMLVDGRNARARREEEIAAERAIMNSQRTEMNAGVKNWWDTDLDEAGDDEEPGRSEGTR